MEVMQYVLGQMKSPVMIIKILAILAFTLLHFLSLENQVIDYNLTIGNCNLINCSITGDVTGTSGGIIQGNTINGALMLTATNNLKVFDNIITDIVPNRPNIYSLYLGSANDSNITGVEVYENTIIGNRTNMYIVNITSSDGEVGYNAINELKFIKNKVVNTGIAGGSCHTVFIGGGINNTIKYNDITMSGGYGFVIKSGGVQYTTTDAHLSYNIIRYTNASGTFAILPKSVGGIIIANNTIINAKGGYLYALGADDGIAPELCSATFINNLAILGGNVFYTSGGRVGLTIVFRNNATNKKWVYHRNS